MSVGLYDKALTTKIEKWLNNVDGLTITSPDETRRLFQQIGDEKNDAPIKLPLVAIRRGREVSINNVNKRSSTFDGLTLSAEVGGNVVSLQRIPVSISYQIDIYTRFFSEADDYARNFLFNLINYPSVTVEIPYNGTHYTHTSNITVAGTISDNSDIPERLIAGQFTRMTIPFVIDDAYIWSVPIRNTLSIEATVKTDFLQGEIKNA